MLRASGGASWNSASRPEPRQPSAIISQEETSGRIRQMNNDRSKNKDYSKRTLRGPVVVAIAVAVFGVLAMLVVDHGPWSRPNVEAAETANYKTTGAAR